MGMKDNEETKVLLEEEEEEEEEEGDVESRKYFRLCSGIIAAFGSAILFTSSATSVQLLERRIPDFELNIFRFGVPLLFSLIYLIFSKQYPIIERGKIRTTIFYGFIVFIASFCYFVAVSLLPAALVASLQNASSIIVSLAFFSLWWDERITVSKTLFAVICIIGVVMVTQPKFIKNKDVQDKVDILTEDETDVIEDVTKTIKLYVPDQVNKMSMHLQTEKNVSTSLTKDEEIISNLSVTSKKATVHKITGLSILEEKLKPDSFLGQLVGYIFGVMAGVAMSTSILVVKRNPYIQR